MKAIMEHSPEEYQELSRVYKEFSEKTNYLSAHKLLNDLNRRPGYAHYTFSGYISDELIEMLGRMPTTDEIIMLVDNGFSHFGASCSITGKFFRGKVYTD